MVKAINNKRSGHVASFGSIVLAISLIIPAAPASAEAENPEWQSDVREHLERFGVPEGQAGRLIKDIEAGEAWDVYRDEMAPERTDRKIIDGMDYTIERFADGSFSARGIAV